MKISAFWFRRDLRLIDNHGLYEAIKSGKKVLCFFIFDRNILNGLPDKKDARIHFIFQQVRQLKLQLNNIGSDLMIAYDYPDKAWIKWITQFDIETIFLNRDYEPYAVQRDDLLNEICHKKGIILKAYKDHVLFEKSEVLKEDQTTYTVFTPYKRKWLEKLNQIGDSEAFIHYPVEMEGRHFFPLEPTPLPSMEFMGFIPSDLYIPEAKDWQRVLSKYSKQRDFPGVDGTSRLGIHLRFGTISIREVARKAFKISETFLSELIWRDFYSMILQAYPNVVGHAFKPLYDRINWLNSEEEFNLWYEGKTGYPLVDAGMRELNATGFMHNRVRMVTASFLVKHLLIDWRWGEAYFANKLLDFDLASNNGGWQWAAGCGTDAAPYFRIFNPEAQQKKFDPKFEYIQKWVPEFNTAAYPNPIVNHAESRKRCLEVYKLALSDG